MYQEFLKILCEFGKINFSLITQSCFGLCFKREGNWMFISCSSEHLQWWKTAQEGIDQDRWFLCADYSWRTRLNIWYLIINLTRRDTWYLITNSSYYLGWNNSGWCIGSQIELWHDWGLFKCYRFWKRLERKFYCVFLVHYDTSPFTRWQWRGGGEMLKES